MTCTRSEHVRVLPGHATDEAATEVTRRRRHAGTGTATWRGHYGLPLRERGGRVELTLGLLATCLNSLGEGRRRPSSEKTVAAAELTVRGWNSCTP